jgi:hypothetical protein
VLLQEYGAALVVGTAVNQMHPREALRRAGGWVDMVTTEVANEFKGLLDGDAGEILVAKCCLWSATIHRLDGK